MSQKNLKTEKQENLNSNTENKFSSEALMTLFIRDSFNKKNKNK